MFDAGLRVVILAEHTDDDNVAMRPIRRGSPKFEASRRWCPPAGDGRLTAFPPRRSSCGECYGRAAGIYEHDLDRLADG
jgi:ribosomal protein S27AE